MLAKFIVIQICGSSYFGLDSWRIFCFSTSRLLTTLASTVGQCGRVCHSIVASVPPVMLHGPGFVNDLH